MKNTLITLVFCMLFGVSVQSQPEGRKEKAFAEIRDLRLQYRSDMVYLGSSPAFDNRIDREDWTVRLQRTKTRIDSLDRAYTRLLTPSELSAYADWKRKEDLKDRNRDLGWWYATLLRPGC